MTRQERPILVIDGHDGAGKSSVGRCLAARLGATMVKPFNDSAGEIIDWLLRTERFDLAHNVARHAVKKTMQDIDGQAPLIFDRHWLTMFTVLPGRYHRNWFPLPKTVLCWADLDTTLRRLQERGEAVGDVAVHEYYLKRYRELARSYDVPIVDTSNTCAEQIVTQIIELIGIE